MLNFLLPSENWEHLLRVVFKTSLPSEAAVLVLGVPGDERTLNWEPGCGCDSSLPPLSLPWMCLWECLGLFVNFIAPSAHILFLQYFTHSFC